MLKEIIKRDGVTIEPVIAPKVNGWGQWAAEHLGDKVDWSTVVMEACRRLPERASSSELMDMLITVCLERESWSDYMMAGRLYAVQTTKQIYGSLDHPSIQALHSKLVGLGLMRDMGYTDTEYAQIQEFIDHSRDYHTPHFALYHIRHKYAITNKVKKLEYETQQFVYMRMAMTICEHDAPGVKVANVKEFYDEFANRAISAPTPNYVNFGTTLESYASCCIYASDDTIPSLAAGDSIAYIMTAASSGLGSNIMTRSSGDPIRGGAIKHQGKHKYWVAVGAATDANMQNGRGGAVNVFLSGFDPEADKFSVMQNPLTPVDRQNRSVFAALIQSKFMARKVARNEDIFTFNCFTAPDLYAAIYGKDPAVFEALYNTYEQDPTFKKNYVSAREVVLRHETDAYGVGTNYLMWADEVNHHTPFLDAIYSLNLCMEVAQPTKPYKDHSYLYRTDDHGEGEISMCNLGAINLVDEMTDEQYARRMYLILKMITYTILNSKYPFPHLAFTAKARRNAGIGIMGLATHMARKQLSYDTPAGRQEMHRLAERHMYFAIRASLDLSKEFGLAPWIHKTRWPEGWTPQWTYNRNVDQLGDFTNQYDWESLSAEIKANGGLAHSVLVCHMPGESSSKALASPNGLYKIREKVLVKKDGNLKFRWAAPQSDNPDYHYESAWLGEKRDMIATYAIWQKWTDGAISADFHKPVPKGTPIMSSELLQDYLDMTKYGLKSHYYLNTLPSDDVQLEMTQSAFERCVTLTVHTEPEGCESCKF